MAQSNITTKHEHKAKISTVCPKCNEDYCIDWQSDSSMEGGFEIILCGGCFSYPEELSDNEYTELMIHLQENRED